MLLAAFEEWNCDRDRARLAGSLFALLTRLAAAQRG
jgi:hypothetical protein